MRLSPENLAMGNGTTQFIYAIPQALGIKSALVVAPTYADYHDACMLVGACVGYSFLDRARGFVPDLEEIARKARASEMVFFCNPNNPTGVFTPSDTLAHLVRLCPETLFVIDESYLPFCGSERVLSLARQGLPNALIMMSLSKMYALAGLRVGFLHGPSEIMAKIRLWCPPWSVNALATMAVEYLAKNEDEAFAHAERTRAFCAHEVNLWLECFANDTRVRFYPGAATFLLGKLARGAAAALCEHLRGRRILVRDCANFAGLSPAWFRVSMKGEKENARLRRELGRWLESPEAHC
jgi:threonine-phosphate decarboxylase